MMTERSELADPEVMPILPSLDLDETLAFYRDRLGFPQVIHHDTDYLILRRDHMELHFWLTDDPYVCERSAVYFRGGAIDALYDEFRDREVEKLSHFSVRPWNMKEFYVWDPHGNLLKFGRIPLQGEALETTDRNP